MSSEMKNKILDTLYSYEADKFMPIFENGELSNRREFFTYKASALARGFRNRLPVIQ